MARLVLCSLALLVAGILADSVRELPHKVADQVLLKKQVDVLNLFYHIHEPIYEPELQDVVKNWNLEQNVDSFTNTSAVHTYLEMLKGDLKLPRGVPVALEESEHVFEVKVMFNVLYSAKDFDTFYKTAVYLRNKVNEGLFVYVLSVVVLHRPDTQGIVLPPIYEILPSYFHNSEVLSTAQRVNIHGKRLVEHYENTYVWDENVVIRSNVTVWPYYNEDLILGYYTQDVTYNAYYYHLQLLYPIWLGKDIVPLVKDRRGEYYWFYHKQILARYYMERLSNGLGEISELGVNVVEQGYVPDISYFNGVNYPVRPNHFHLDQPEFVEAITKIIDYEHRIRESIDAGCVINHVGEPNSQIKSWEAIEILGNLIHANEDSINQRYYKDFISIWKKLLGNTLWQKPTYHKEIIPLVVPSALETYGTALRDPAFYMIWKRVMTLFSDWQKSLPLYTKEELLVPSVVIKSVEVDKLVTYFEHVYYNVTNNLHMSESESKTVTDNVSVLVQRPQLNHKAFTVRVNVKSEVAKTVVVKFFLAPKYDSKGYEIPLHVNIKNFYQLDQFVYDLPVGDVVIKRNPSDNWFTIRNWTPGYEVYEKAYNALHGQGQFIVDQTHRMDGFPDHLLLPKGRVGGMPFVFLVYISEYRPAKVPYASNFDPASSLGLGSGARWLNDQPFAFPLDRTMYKWQAQDIHNLFIQDVSIFHKHVPEVVVHHAE